MRASPLTSLRGRAELCSRCGPGQLPHGRQRGNGNELNGLGLSAAFAKQDIRMVASKKRKPTSGWK